MSKREPRWDVDLREGEVAERIVDGVFRGRIPVEVKRDRYALEGTAPGRRVFLETHALNKQTGEWYPSGINASEAEAYVFMLSCREREVVGIIVGVDRLRALARSKDSIEVAHGGTHPTKGVFIGTFEVVMSANGDRS